MRAYKSRLLCNFKNGNPNLECQLGCGEKEETQQHILLCDKILQKMSHKPDITNYEDIFGSEKKQKRIIGIFTEMINIREKPHSPVKMNSVQICLNCDQIISF